MTQVIGRVGERAANAAQTATSRPVLTVFAVALVVRVVLALAIYVFFDGTLFNDDLAYARLTQAVVDGQTANWDSYSHFLYDGTATFTYPLTFLFEVFTTELIVGQLFVALLGALAAAAVTKLGMEVAGVKLAVVGGLLIALLPSQVLWSSLILKDAMVSLLLAMIALAVIALNRSAGRRLFIALLGIGCLLLLMGRLREHTLVLASWAVAAASFAGASVDRVKRISGAVLVAVLVPWVVGYGPAGADFVRNAGSLETRRILNAQKAESAIVDEEGNEDGDTGGGGNGTPEEIDESTSAAPPGDDGVSADIRHLPRGLSVMLLEPYPWQTSTSEYFLMAKIEAVLWYPVLLIAALGLPLAFRRLRTMLFPLLAGAGSLAVYALAEGNLGTAYRHRGEFVWVVALLFGLGVGYLIERRKSEVAGD